MSKAVPEQSPAPGGRPRFTFEDWGWVALSIGMGIGAGIAFAPIPVGMCGLWVFLPIALIGYSGVFLFQRLFVDIMSESDKNTPYPDTLVRYLGNGWGRFLGLLYFLMLVIWFFVYTEAIVRDSASYLVTFKALKNNLSGNFFYVFGVITALTVIAAQGEKLLFKLGSLMTITIMLIIFLMGMLMIPDWSVSHIASLPARGTFFKKGLWLLPFVLTSILFLQSLSPMVVYFREKSATREIAHYRARRAHFIAFMILFTVVFFYVLSFAFALTQGEAEAAYNDNISALALLAQKKHDAFIRVLEVMLEIFAVMTSFFSVYLALRESMFSSLSKIFARRQPERKIKAGWLNALIAGLLIAGGGAVVLTDVPILMFTVICSPIFGIIGCLIPAWMTLRLPHLKKYRGIKVVFIIIIGIMLCLAPLAALLISKEKHAAKTESHKKIKTEQIQPR